SSGEPNCESCRLHVFKAVPVVAVACAAFDRNHCAFLPSLAVSSERPAAPGPLIVVNGKPYEEGWRVDIPRWEERQLVRRGDAAANGNGSTGVDAAGGGEDPGNFESSACVNFVQQIREKRWTKTLSTYDTSLQTTREAFLDSV
ncbi:unnamed protein product, partial [Scytosiphon promiscuus]